MDWNFHQLEPVQDLDLSLVDLPRIWPQFSISALPEMPQDPIMDTLSLRRGNQKVHSEARPAVVHGVVHENLYPDVVGDDIGNMWEKAAHEPRQTPNVALSWDALREHSACAASSSAFLSERSAQALSAVRYYVDPPLKDPHMDLIYTLPWELFESVQMLLVGISSPLHVWDPISETFTLRGVRPGRTGVLVISGMDEVVSQSLVQRFLVIGVLIRRLERLIAKIRKSAATTEASLHAFAHALSSFLDSVRNNIGNLISPSSGDECSTSVHPLSALWHVCADVQLVLEHLASLCGREITLKPAEYCLVPQSTPDLLSAIYKELESHLDSHFPRSAAAVFAYLLTEVSGDYFKRVCHSVGYGKKDAFQHRSGSCEQKITGIDGDYIQEEVKTTADNVDNFPCFFKPEMSQALLRARQSLELLRTAQPNHSLLSSAESQEEVRWLWTEEEIELVWKPSNIAGSQLPSIRISSQNPFEVDGKAEDGIHDGLQAFKLFDGQPGSHLDTLGRITESSVETGFEAFLKQFPESLPSLTPSLSDLTELILSPLADHIGTLSSALVDTFLSPEAYLSFHVHLDLLRSYILLTSQAFKSRLQSALFSDASEPDTINPGARAIAARRSQQQSTADYKPDRWIIGLATGLTEGDWPPAGTDLSYYLRTVIIDSLDIDHPDRQLSQHAVTTSHEKAMIYEEAEWRLGFAIRDLPTGSGHAKWLDARSIEALDFLYINYQPPSPLNVLIPPSSLSKYHRLFAFNLRLMRVENVVNALFRMTLRDSTPPFVTLTSCQRLFLHFRFLASCFVTSLSSYVYDTAIGGNFDAFLRKILNRATEHDGTFYDVFALGDYHSRVMDDILSACLLRSSQKVVGDILRGVLDIILQFGILISDRQRGVLEEYQAAEPLDELFQKFEERRKTLIKALKSIVEKGAISRVPPEDVRMYVLTEALTLSQAVGVTANLQNLLVRLDGSAWWTHHQPL